MNNTIPEIFCYNKLKLHKERSVKLLKNDDFLINEGAVRIIERLEYLSGGFKNILNMTSSNSFLSDKLNNSLKPELLVNQGISPAVLQHESHIKVIAQEELNPFAQSSFDLVASNLAFHNINDVPGALIQINRTLKKDGMFIASMFGGSTLHELKHVTNEVEIEKKGGISPRFSPLVDIKTIGSLLQQTGFKLPVSDSEILKVSYNNIHELIADLRMIGETNSLKQTANPLNKSIFSEINKRYLEKFSDGDGGIIASFEIITITGMAG